MDDGQVLESWKEISAFLGRDIRTCQRWESEMDLPIHRLDGSPRARVFAYKDELSAWLDQKLREHPSDAIVAAPPKRRFLRPVVFALIALPALAVAFTVFRAVVPPKPRPLPAGYVPPVLAVFPFENKSGDKRLDPWRDALGELLSADLSQSKYLRVVSRGQMLTALRRFGLADSAACSSEDMAKVAALTRAAHILSGSFAKGGEAIIITADLQETGLGRSSAVLQLVARDEPDIIPKVDTLARRVKKALRLTRGQIAYDFAMEAGQAVTSSPEALKSYVEGRRLQMSNRWPEAIASLEKAIAIDPEFAMAYRSLAVAQRDVGQLAEALASIRKAVELSARLPDGERDFIEGQLAFWADDYAKAIEILENLLKTHPGHLNALTYLGYAASGAGDIDKAIEYQTLVTRNRNTVLDVRTLAGYLQRKGRYQEAASLLLSFIQNVEDVWTVHQVLAYTYCYLRDFDLALVEARKTHAGNPRMLAAEAEVLIFKDDLLRAEALMGPEMLCLGRGRFAANIAYARTELARARAQGAIDDEAAAGRRLALALEKAGRFAEAIAACDDYLRLSAESRALAGGAGLPYRPFIKKQDLFIKARILAEMGQADEALKTAEELKSVIDAGLNRKDLKLYEYVQGLAGLGRGDPKGAAELFGSACGHLDFEDFWTSEQGLFLDRYAEALRESGDLDKARETYEKITLLTTGRRTDGDIYARSYYWLGKIADLKGDAGTARAHYRKFLALWEGADPGLPEVADAAARLSRR